MTDKDTVVSDSTWDDIFILHEIKDESYGGTISELTRIKQLRGWCYSVHHKGHLLGVLGVTRPDENGEADLCTVYSKWGKRFPVAFIKACLRMMKVLDATYKKLYFAIPEGTDDRFAKLTGFTKEKTVNGYDVYVRG